MNRLFGIILSLVLGLLMFGVVPSVHAQFTTPNNPFGVHLISPTDEEIRDACRDLVNANGGAGGKLTLTLVKDDIDLETLQRFHDIARREQCIFIHPIKNSFGDPYWDAIDSETVNFFVDLFKDLRPSSKHIIVSIGNETNRPDEWGGSCDPVGYAKIAREASEKLKKAVPNIKIGLAGLDPFAPNGRLYCSRDEFVKKVFETDPTLVSELIDFHVIHEYPDADMTGALRSHWKSEQSLFRSLGVTKDLPVLITEINWRRHRGLTAIGAAQRLSIALERLKNEPDVWAITPFVYKFCGHPFDQFSMVGCDGNVPNSVFYSLADIQKIEGEPEHIHSARSLAELTNEVIENTDYEFELEISNNGTDIWRGISGDYSLKLFGPDVRSSFSSFYRVGPENTLRTVFRFNPGDVQGCPEYKVAMTKKGRVLLQLFEWQPCVVPHPTMEMKISTFPGRSFTGVGEVQIFNEHENLVFRKQVEVIDGIASVGSVDGVRFEDEYRVVWLSAGNLPVQIVKARFHRGNNVLSTPMLLPIDNNEDGSLTLGDVFSGFQNQGF